MTDQTEAVPDPVTDPTAAISEAVAEAEAAAIAVEADFVALAAERDEFRTTAQRLQADFENYRKRVVREQTVLVERATEALVEQLLPVLDSFDLALQSFDAAETDREAVRKGVLLAVSELRSVLERNGLARIDSAGAPFDPNEHEAVMQDDGDGEPVVGEVLRAGYALKGRVIRPAMVRVARTG